MSMLCCPSFVSAAGGSNHLNMTAHAYMLCLQSVSGTARPPSLTVKRTPVPDMLDALWRRGLTAPQPLTQQGVVSQGPTRRTTWLFQALPSAQAHEPATFQPGSRGADINRSQPQPPGAPHLPRNETRFGQQQQHRQPRFQERQQRPGRGFTAHGRPQGRFPRPHAEPMPSPAKQYKMVLRATTELPGGLPKEDRVLRTGMAVTWLGTSSGSPTLDRNVSCTALRLPGVTWLVDCGEGSHRQLPTAGLDLADMQCICITHLHGDHCYGLGAALLAIDAVKAEAAQAGAALHPTPAAHPPHSSSTQPARQPAHQQQQQQQQGEAVDDPRQAPSTTWVYGPPGLGQLLEAQLVVTGAHTSLRTHFVVTELVMDESMEQLQPMHLDPACTHLWLRRQGPRTMLDVPSLVEAWEQLLPDMEKLPSLWRPPRPSRQPLLMPEDGLPPGTAWHGQHTRSGMEAEGVYGGRSYVAAEGMMWDVQGPPGSPIRCAAAQLQHRVPCWGYVMQEAKPQQPGVRRRKVVLLGDTISSRPIAPLALGADLLAHEATFMEGMDHVAQVAQHSMAWMAGAFANVVQTRLLVLTHFSARYETYGTAAPRSPMMREPAQTAEEEAMKQRMAIRDLLNEARREFPGGHVVAASDFFTVHVPLVPVQAQQGFPSPQKQPAAQLAR
ncbi:beta-lactamase-like protein [Haematococcus lacustris]